MPSNFIADYRLFTSGNEANENYHLWSSLVILSSVVSRKIWLDLGYFKIYPNLYVVLLGDPGNKKTTAMRLAKNMVLDFDPRIVSADCQSAQDTVKMLADEETALRVATLPSGASYAFTPVTIFATELSQFIEIDPARMIDLWVTVFDCDDYTKRTLRHNIQTITGPCFNILGCTTPSWVTRYLKTDIFTGGFSRRAIFVLESYDDRRVPFPEITPEMREAEKRCRKRLQEIDKLVGPVEWTKEARDFYENWYLTRQISQDTAIGYFDRTKFVQFLKVAMLLTAACCDKLLLTLDTLKLSMAMVDETISRLPDVFNAMGRNELADVANKLLTILKANGGLMKQSELFVLLFRDAKTAELYQVVSHLVESGRIVRIKVGGVDALCVKDHPALKNAVHQQPQSPPAAT